MFYQVLGYVLPGVGLWFTRCRAMIYQVLVWIIFAIFVSNSQSYSIMRNRYLQVCIEVENDEVQWKQSSENGTHEEPQPNATHK